MMASERASPVSNSVRLPRRGGGEVVERDAPGVASACRRAGPGERPERVEPQLAGRPLGRAQLVLLAVDRLGEHVRQPDDVVVVDVADHDHLQEQRSRAGRNQLLEAGLQCGLVDTGRATVDEDYVVAVVEQQAVPVLGAEDFEGEGWLGHGYTNWIARRMSSIPWPW